MENGKAPQSASVTGLQDGAGQPAASAARRKPNHSRLRLTGSRGGSDVERFGRAVLAEMFNDGILPDGLPDPLVTRQLKPNGKHPSNGKHGSNGSHESNGDHEPTK